MKKLIPVITLLFFRILTVFSQDPAHNYIKSTSTVASGRELVTIQYYDGLGRPFEKVLKNISPDGSNLVSLTEYDGLGREKSNYLPLSSSSDFLSPPSIRSDAPVQYGNSRPYTVSSYESSPLNRINEVVGAGVQWSSHPKKTEYLHNSPTFPLACKDYSCSPSGALVDNGIYAGGTLNVLRLTDEDGNDAYEFRDMQGMVVLSRLMTDASASADTYYVYDHHGDLRYVLQPEYQNDGDTDRFAFRYSYDARHNVVEKRLPGAAAVRYRYDKGNRLIFSQDGVQRDNDIVSFILYDNLNRPVVSGECSASCLTDVSSIYVTSSFSPASGGICNTGYTSNIALSGVRLELAHYYDTYGFLSLDAFSSLGMAEIPESNTGYETGTIIAALDTLPGLLCRVNIYDIKGRVTKSVSSNHLSGTDTHTAEYNLSGSVTKSVHIHTASGKPSITEETVYIYDGANRLTEENYNLNGGTPVCLQSNTYDRLGRLVSKSVLDGNEVISYTYNIRDNLTRISSPKFSENLYYYESQYPSFNGNISKIAWQTSSDTDLRCYQFRYDGMSRLVSAKYGESLSMNNNTDLYSTEYGYDLNGNILSLKRNGMLDDGCWGYIDNIRFSYDGNRMIKADDTVAGPYYKDAFHFSDNADADMEYFYDSNGNMTRDMNNGIYKVVYNSLNLPHRILFDNGSSLYKYNAQGEKLQVSYDNLSQAIMEPGTKVMEAVSPVSAFSDMAEKSVSGNILANDSIIWNEYARLDTVVNSRVSLLAVSTVDYCGNIIYDRGRTVIQNSIGYVTFNGGTPVYHYYLRDHLGNNRVVVNVDGTVEQVNHYYPYGGLFGESYGGSIQPYRYNGKELDRTHGLDWYDYGARMFDAAAVVWRTQDQMAEKYYNISPYVYCASNPVNAVDPDGNKVELFVTRLPGQSDNDYLASATHTFIVVTDAKGNSQRFAYGSEMSGVLGVVLGRLKQQDYTQDELCMKDRNNSAIKAIIEIPVPESMSSDDFDKKVIDTAKSYGNNRQIQYFVLPLSETTGNCNSSSYTLLYKSGVSKKLLDQEIGQQIPDIKWGWGMLKPWTKQEQKEAVKREIKINESLNNVL